MHSFRGWRNIPCRAPMLQTPRLLQALPLIGTAARLTRQERHASHKLPPSVHTPVSLSHCPLASISILGPNPPTSLLPGGLLVFLQDRFRDHVFSDNFPNIPICLPACAASALGSRCCTTGGTLVFVVTFSNSRHMKLLNKDFLNE